MNLTVEIPDDVAAQLNAAAAGDLSRRVLEAFALEEYKSGHLSDDALRRMLGLTRYQLDGFLKARNVWIECTIEELRSDLATLEQLNSKA